MNGNSMMLGENGNNMMLGEFESMKVIEIYALNFTPHPIAWGTLEADSSIQSFWSDLRKMDQKVPKMENLCFKLAEMRKYSHAAGIKQFRFHVTTHNGSLTQDNTLSNSWEELYAKAMRDMLDLEENHEGRSLKR
ncbi:hypothetical protein MMC18_004941 [Xylographa bjoerkii]|nr:hypothetical protein [Xylographa bjoerkii]